MDRFSRREADNRVIHHEFRAQRNEGNWGRCMGFRAGGSMAASKHRRLPHLANFGVAACFMFALQQSCPAEEVIWKSSSSPLPQAAAPASALTPRLQQPPTLILVESQQAIPSSPELPSTPNGEDNKRTLPINLPTAFKLAQVQPIDIQVASQRIRAAQAQLDRANVLWLPTIYGGVDYARQDGQIQDVAGRVFGTSKSSFMAGAGPYAVFAVSDAIYAPLSARQVVQARNFDRQAALNDTMLSVAEAYFAVQQARGELAGALDAVKRSRDLVERTEKLAKDLVNPVEVVRARTELSRREQAVESAYDRRQTASSELARLLRLDAAAVAEPVEQPHLRIELIDAAMVVDDLIPIALRNRPELASQQALVQATLARLKQERMRPFIPSLALRGNATNPSGTLSGGAFGGGLNSNLSNFGARQSADVQLLWEFQNLGLGNRATIRERQTENQVALLEMLRVQDRIAAEVAQFNEQTRRAANRARLAEEGLKNAVESAQKNLELITQTRRVGDLLVLVIRPQEAVASMQALDQAYRDFYGAIADVNRAQFRLYRALGKPAQCVMEETNAPGGPAPAAIDQPTEMIQRK